MPESPLNPWPEIKKAGPQPAFSICPRPNSRTRPEKSLPNPAGAKHFPSQTYNRRARHFPGAAPSQLDRTSARRRRQICAGSPTPINPSKNRFKALWSPPNPGCHQPLTPDSKKRLIGRPRLRPPGTAPGIQNQPSNPTLCQYLARICQSSA